mmetsp:Transcript_20471/g.28801  ORF Transcript_20471/g.28801 Transcript_20471/m.28801 type:complete len:727 (+) Transcript_20471:113-2293(+)|eukprot:CAMPEP_0184870348 /NCGR_PEP_ID=MMETSP0580-20130426/37181_1 /TAXON_ID=1118495 /ORGANISM="Dactyliosolen fragilissimus" /LENGTH=726 /DNA_ID=CAMNT_0027372377 /DNA_START=35 /DNA_END=2215 /DNA_ORIENTATION=+
MKDSNHGQDIRLPTFLKSAHDSANYMVASYIRAVLETASSQILQKIVQQRLESSRHNSDRSGMEEDSIFSKGIGGIVNDNCNEIDKDMVSSTASQSDYHDNYDENSDDSNKNFENKKMEMHISWEDTQYAYSISTHVGYRWIEKLEQNNEYDIANLVRLVIRNGKFFEDVDDFNVMERKNLVESTGSSSCSAKKHRVNNSFTSETTDPQHLIANHMNTTVDQENPCYTFLGSQNGSTSKNHSAFSLPYDTLSKMGAHFTFKSSQEEEAKKTVDSETGIGPSPVPTDDNNEGHASNIILPNQLYGNPTKTCMNFLSFHTNGHALNTPFYNTRAPNFPIDNHHGERAFLKNEIRKIDELCTTNDGTTAYWCYGNWDIIQRAVDRNFQRIHINKTSPSGKSLHDLECDTDPAQCHEIIPKPFEDHNGVEFSGGYIEGHPNNIIQECSDAKDGDTSINDLDIVSPSIAILKRKRVSTIIERKKQRNDAKRKKIEQQSKDSVLDITSNRRDTIMGREPSKIGSCKWSWQTDIFDYFSVPERKALENSMLHGDIEVERKRESEYHQALGALKLLGSLYLWEKQRETLGQYTIFDGVQTPPLELKETSSQDLRARNRSYRRAKKDRLAGFVDVKPKGSDVPSRISSKVIWAELPPMLSDKTTKKYDNNSASFNTTRNKQAIQSLELDLGECTISLGLTLNWKNDVSEKQHVQKIKKLFSFRSLEISLFDNIRA